MALHLPYGIELINPKANIDEHYGPYMSVEAANAAVPIAIRAVGRTVGILDSETNKITEYWWQCGIADDNLVEKTADVALLHALSTSKADKVTGATNGDIAGLDANGNLKDSGKSINDFKLKQQNVVDPTASGESITFIDSISQNEDGVIAPIKKTVKTATSASGDVPAAAGLMSSSDKSKLDSIANGAQVNVIEGVKVNGQLVVPDSDKNVNVTIQNPDWNQTTSAESDYILNKPAIKAGQGENSIIEGDLNGNSSTGNYSHTEGTGTTASGNSSHAEGQNTTASGVGSHAEGYVTIAKHKSQHVFGEYNIADPSLNSPSARGNYVEIVGNGVWPAMSNARTLDWAGNETLAGNLAIGGTITANGQQILPQVQVDWNQTTSTESDYIKNKPAIKAGQGENSIIEGNLAGNSSTGTYSHAEGSYSTASGSGSHAEGGSTTASGSASHAEGASTTSSGTYSHAEGQGSTASGIESHAEGGSTTASGRASHAEGTSTTATGDYSHVEGRGTTAKNKSQHVFGEHNIADPSANTSINRGNYVEIVGKGTDNTHRSNARTLDWQGNEVLAGTITANGINISEAISTVKLRINSGSLQASIDGGTSWHTINFAD